MEAIFTPEFFNMMLIIMAAVGLVVFISLYFVDAGYGKMISAKWGPAMPNKWGWMLMECPVFFIVLYLWWTAAPEVKYNAPYLLFFLFFELHYFQRSFIFPFLLKGKSKMPIAIMAMSVIWNLINGYIQGYWLFHLAPANPTYSVLYSTDWLTSWQFIA